MDKWWVLLGVFKVRLARFERATYGLGIRFSNTLTFAITMVYNVHNTEVLQIVLQ